MKGILTLGLAIALAGSIAACDTDGTGSGGVVGPTLAKGGNGGGKGGGGGSGGGSPSEPSPVVGYVVPATTTSGSANALRGDGLDYDAGTPLETGDTRYEDAVCNVAVIVQENGGVTSYDVFLNEGRGKKGCTRQATLTFPDGSPLGEQRTNEWKVNWTTSAADAIGESTIGWGKISLQDVSATCDPFRFNPTLGGFEGTDSFEVARVEGGWRILALSPENLGVCETDARTPGDAYAVDVEWMIDEDLGDGVEVGL